MGCNSGGKGRFQAHQTVFRSKVTKEGSFMPKISDLFLVLVQLRDGPCLSPQTLTLSNNSVSLSPDFFPYNAPIHFPLCPSPRVVLTAVLLPKHSQSQLPWGLIVLTATMPTSLRVAEPTQTSSYSQKGNSPVSLGKYQHLRQHHRKSAPCKI